MEQRLPEYKNVIPECIRRAVEEDKKNVHLIKAAQKRRIKNMLYELKQSLK